MPLRYPMTGMDGGNSGRRGWRNVRGRILFPGSRVDMLVLSRYLQYLMNLYLIEFAVGIFVVQ